MAGSKKTLSTKQGSLVSRLRKDRIPKTSGSIKTTLRKLTVSVVTAVLALGFTCPTQVKLVSCQEFSVRKTSLILRHYTASTQVAYMRRPSNTIRLVKSHSGASTPSTRLDQQSSTMKSHKLVRRAFWYKLQLVLMKLTTTRF
ncbi:hypothetical protein D3C80_1614600 [compost metagenome]